METSSWRTMNTRHHTRAHNTNAFPSIFRPPQSTMPNPPPPAMIHKRAPYGAFTSGSPLHMIPPREKNKNKSLGSLVAWCIDWFIERIFSSYPLWIQSIMTAIIGFISYFLYDYAIGLQSLHFYIVYKAASLIGFLISVFFVYVVLINVSKPRAMNTPPLKDDKSPVPVPPVTVNPFNPYSTKPSSQHTNTKPKRTDELYFTAKSMLNRVSSQVLNTVQNENKLDYNSSPQKIESLDPTQIATHENLNKFIQKQANSSHKSGGAGDIATPVMNNATPIGKTFGSMRMTPAQQPWNTPNKSINKTNQGSAGIYTPNSSMDVTMMSYDNNDSEPFNVDFSVIEPKHVQHGNPTNSAWNISGFGGGAVGSNVNRMYLNDVSMMAQPGTPAKLNAMNANSTNSNYVYDGMYSDINLRGDNIGNNLQRQRQQQQQASQRKEGQKVHQQPPVSPFSRKRRNNNNNNAASNNNMSGGGMNNFSAFYMEQSISLYGSLRVDGLIENWAEGMRWWLSQKVVKTRANELVTNDSDIENEIFSLLCARYGIKQQLSELQSASQKEAFIISNEGQLMNVARQANKPSIMHIIQKRKHLKDCIDFICRNYQQNEREKAKEYVHHRIATLSSTNNLTLYNWNSGCITDAELLMTLFCRYMDDVMCPAIKFSQKHYIQISSGDIRKPHKLYKKFKDIAIICVNDMNKNNKSNPHQSLPYFFIAFNRKKFEDKIKNVNLNCNLKLNRKSSLIRKPRHFLGGDSIDEEKEFESNMMNDAHKAHAHKGHKDDVGTWFPQPGKRNLIHTITLFALFIHRYCNDKLTGIALKDQGCTLLQPLLR